jgi:hypothetical protein
MSDELRNSLWNLFFDLYSEDEGHHWRRVATYSAKYFRKVPVDELPLQDWDLRDWVKEYFFSLSWHAAYDLTEFLVHNHREMTTVRYGYNET